MFNKKENDRLAGLRAELASLTDRLAADIFTLTAGEDPVCQQALADASERASSAGALQARAKSGAELDVAKRTVLEGLTATRLVRERQGLPLGADLPADPRTVSAPTAVQFDGQEHVAHADYHPERPHFFAGANLGGVSAPAGYYKTPFWQKALNMGTALVGVELLEDLLGGGGRGGGDGWGGGQDGGGDWGN